MKHKFLDFFVGTFLNNGNKLVVIEQKTFKSTMDGKTNREKEVKVVGNLLYSQICFINRLHEEMSDLEFRAKKIINNEQSKRRKNAAFP